MPSTDPAPPVTDLVFEFLERVESSRNAPSTVLEDLCRKLSLIHI